MFRTDIFVRLPKEWPYVQSWRSRQNMRWFTKAIRALFVLGKDFFCGFWLDGCNIFQNENSAIFIRLVRWMEQANFITLSKERRKQLMKSTTIPYYKENKVLAFTFEYNEMWFTITIFWGSITIVKDLWRFSLEAGKRLYYATKIAQAP